MAFRMTQSKVKDDFDTWKKDTSALWDNFSYSRCSENLCTWININGKITQWCITSYIQLAWLIKLSMLSAN